MLSLCVWNYCVLSLCVWSYCLLHSTMCVKFVCVKLLYMLSLCVWSVCVLCVFCWCVKLLSVKFVSVKFVCVKLLYVKFVCVKFVCVKFVCVKLLSVKFVCVKFVCVKLLYVKFVCVLLRRRREEEEEKPGIQNQKQEPHTKMWGKKHIWFHHFYCEFCKSLTTIVRLSIVWRFTTLPMLFFLRHLESFVLSSSNKYASVLTVIQNKNNLLFDFWSMLIICFQVNNYPMLISHLDYCSLE